MADKRQFRTIETDEDELNSKIRSHRLKIIKTLLVVAGIVLLVCAAVFLFMRLRQYSSYAVEKSIEREDSSTSHFAAYGKGFLKYSNDGISYMDAENNLYWNQTYEMRDPMLEQCEGFAAIADTGGTEIYILNETGFQGKIDTTMGIDKISVANQGTVAVLMEQEGANYIRLYDKSGRNLVGGALHVENSGYPMDIALCNDGQKLAVSMLNTKGGSLCATVKFYNFGSVGQNEIDNLVGEYDYENLVIPQIEFMTNDRLVAFGDSKVIIFEGTQKPEPNKEIAVENEIKSVFCNEKYIGLISNNEEKTVEETRHMEIYDIKGKRILRKDFSMNYESVGFLNSNEICIRNADECIIYNTYGVEKFTYTFEKPLYAVMSGSTQTQYVFILEGTTEKVRLQ